MAALALASCSPGSGPEDEGRPQAAPGAPNVIMIVLDDATVEQVNGETMPLTARLLAEEGSSFSDFILTTPLCCPSRASLLTGQYSHNHGAIENQYVDLDRKGNILPVWLQRAGYRTAHLGKYLNGFKQGLDEPTQVPAGWDDWFTILQNGYYDYEIADNGGKREFGSDPDDYVTRVLNDRAAELIDDYAEGDEPFYLQLDQFAPHFDPAGGDPECGDGAVPAPEDYELVDRHPLPAKPSVNEADVSDKPWFIRAYEPMSRSELRRADTEYACAAASLREVDRGVGELVDALEDTGELDETAIFFTSDNGYYFGEHRIPDKKKYPYEEGVKAPLLVRLPAELAPPSEDRPAEIDVPVANIDLAPTILELASAAPCMDSGTCRQIDGRSLLPLLTSADARWPRDRALLVELGNKVTGPKEFGRPCGYSGIRVDRRLYIEHELAGAPGGPCRRTDAVEHYDLAADPYQLENLAGDEGVGGEERQLRRRLNGLRDCAGNRVDPDAGDEACE